MFDRNDFNRRFQRNDFIFKFMFRAITAFIIVVFLAIISFWIMIGVLTYKAADQVGEHGLHTVLEQIWCGKNTTNCKLPF